MFGSGFPREFQRSQHLFTRYGGVIFQKLIEPFTCLKRVKQILERYTRSDKYRHAALNFGITVDNILFHRAPPIMDIIIARTIRVGKRPGRETGMMAANPWPPTVFSAFPDPGNASLQCKNECVSAIMPTPVPTITICHADDSVSGRRCIHGIRSATAM